MVMCRSNETHVIFIVDAGHDDHARKCNQFISSNEKDANATTVSLIFLFIVLV